MQFIAHRQLSSLSVGGADLDAVQTLPKASMCLPLQTPEILIPMLQDEKHITYISGVRSAVGFHAIADH